MEIAGHMPHWSGRFEDFQAREFCDGTYSTDHSGKLLWATPIKNMNGFSGS